MDRHRDAHRRFLRDLIALVPAERHLGQVPVDVRLAHPVEDAELRLADEYVQALGRVVLWTDGPPSSPGLTNSSVL